MVKVLDSFDSRSEKKDKGYSKFMQPLQFLPTKEKDEEWRKQCMDWFEYVGEEQIKQKVNRLTKNYNLAAGIIDKNDYILDEDNENFELIEKLTDDDFSAYELKFYPIIPNVVNLLLGEFNKHAERITYVAVDDKSYNEYLEAKRAEIEKVLFEYGQQLMQQRIQAMGLDPNNQEHRAQIEEMLRPETIAKLKEIENFFRKDYQSLVEQWAVHQHNIDMERFDLTELERTAFYDALVTDSEFWHFKMNENDYDIEVLNPKYVFYCKPRNVKYISDGLYAGFIDFMTVADVIDKYGYMMTKEQLEALEEIGDVEDMKYIIPGLDNYYDSSRSHDWNVKGDSLAMRQYTSFRSFVGDTGYADEHQPNDIGGNVKVKVTTVYWKSQRLIGHLTYIDSQGNVYQQIVDENYKVTHKPVYDETVKPGKTVENLIEGEHIEWIWINEVWGGIKISPMVLGYENRSKDDVIPIYLNVAPLRYQFKGNTTLYGCKLPIEGCIFSERNADSRSIVDKMKPFQIAYNLVNNQIADILIDELGTIIMFDHNYLPQRSLSEDWGENSYAKSYMIMKNFQMLPLDSTLNNTESTVAFQHAQVLNLEQTNRLLTRVNLANYFKQQCFEAIGISPQRMSQINAQETATGIQQAINMSYSQTDMLFTQHLEHLMPRIHRMRTDLAQYYHSTNPSVRLTYSTSLEEKVNFSINGMDLLLRDINVYISSRANHKFILEQLKQLAATNNTTGATIYDLGDILKAQSLGELNNVFRRIEERTQEQLEQQRMYEQQMAEQQMQYEMQMKERQLQFEAEQKALDREKDIRVAQIRSTGRIVDAAIKSGLEEAYDDSKKYFEETEREMAEMQDQGQEDVSEIDKRKLDLEKEKLDIQRKKIEADLEIAKINRNQYDIKPKR